MEKLRLKLGDDMFETCDCFDLASIANDVMTSLWEFRGLSVKNLGRLYFFLCTKNHPKQGSYPAIPD